MKGRAYIDRGGVLFVGIAVGAVLLYSTEIAEVIGLSHRVMVVYGGRVADELRGEGINEAAIMAAALGHREHGAGPQPEPRLRAGAFA